MSFSETIPPSPNETRKAVHLSVKGLGHIPAIKNSMFSIVQKENRDWKRRCVKLFVSQLLSTLPIIEHGTPMPPCQRSLIASLPQDDNWKIIPEISIVCRKVQPGDEGAEIVIERLT